MKQNTKETIGSRGTVAGFRPLIGKERWHRGDFTAEMLERGFRPFLLGESSDDGDFVKVACDWIQLGFQGSQVGLRIENADATTHNSRTRRPLPPPQVETFEAHGHVWYRHVPGEAQPVEDDAIVELKFMEGGCTSARASTLKWFGAESYTVIGYRFPDFPAVHTTLQQQQPFAQQPDTTKQRLATMYHGWCDVAPDSVAECITDVAKVLCPTDAERCEAEFQKWLDQREHPGMDVGAASEAWDAAWNAAKQQKP